MKNKKIITRVLSLILIFTFVFSSFVMTASAADHTTKTVAYRTSFSGMTKVTIRNTSWSAKTVTVRADGRAQSGGTGVSIYKNSGTYAGECYRNQTVSFRIPARSTLTLRFQARNSATTTVYVKASGCTVS